METLQIQSIYPVTLNQVSDGLSGGIVFWDVTPGTVNDFAEQIQSRIVVTVVLHVFAHRLWSPMWFFDWNVVPHKYVCICAAHLGRCVGQKRTFCQVRGMSRVSRKGRQSQAGKSYVCRVPEGSGCTF